MSMAEIRTMKEALEKKIKDEGQTALKESFSAFFAANPKIEAIRWRQFTPHFNDGEPCTFSVHGFYYKVDGANADDGDYEDGFNDTYGNALHGHKPAIKAFEKEVQADDVYEAVFGDGVCVTATREGFEVEEYEHD